MKKLLAVTLVALLYGVGLAGCGNDAGFEAVLVMPELGDPGAQACGATVSYIFVQVKVQKSSSDPTPVPDVDIDITPVGVNGTTVLYSDTGLTIAVASTTGVPAPVWHTRTDDNGVAYVNMSTLLGGVPTTSFTATLGFTSTISADQQSATVAPTVSC